MPQSPASPASATGPEPAAGSTLPASSREIEVRRRMAAQELYTDEGPKLEALSEQRTRESS